MSANVRRNLAVQLIAGGENPLRLRLIANPSVLPMKIGQVIGIGMLALVAQGGSPNYAYSITAGALPDGLSLDAGTGAITGTISASLDSSGLPANIGFHGFVAQVEDADDFIFQDSFSVTIDHTLQWTQDAPFDAWQTEAYTYQFIATGGTGSVSYSIVAGSLPSGISLSSTGLLSGTLSSSVGQYTFTVRATDSGSGDEIDISCSLSVFLKLQATASTVPFTLLVGSPPENHSPFLCGIQGGKHTLSISPDPDNPLPTGLSVAVKTFDGGDSSFAFQAMQPFPATAIRFIVRDALGQVAFSQFLTVTAVVANQQLNAGDGSTAVLNPNAITFDPATFDVTDDGSGGLLVVGLGGGDSSGPFVGNQVITADDEFGNSVTDPSSLRIYSDDGSVDVQGEPNSAGGFAWRLRAMGGDSGGPIGSAVPYFTVVPPGATGGTSYSFTPTLNNFGTTNAFAKLSDDDASWMSVNASTCALGGSIPIGGGTYRVAIFGSIETGTNAGASAVYIHDVFFPAGTLSYLDQLSPAPVAAWGLKRLISTYTGNLIHVSNLAGSITGDIGQDGSGNLDSAALTTLAAGGDLYVTTGYDQVSNHDFTNSTTSTCPKIVSAGTYSGKMVFAGAQLLTCATNAIPGGTDFLGIYSRVKLNDTSGVHVVMECGTSDWVSDAPAWVIVCTTANDFGLSDSGSAKKENTYPLATSASIHTWLGDRTQALSTDAAEWFADGTQLTGTSSTNNSLPNPFSATKQVTIGARPGLNFPANIDLKNIAFYNADTSSIRTTIEALM